MVSSNQVESLLSASSTRGARIALIAGSGAGKSSVVSHVLGPDATGVAPIRIPVHPLGEGATTPTRIADEILKLLGRYARDVSTESVTGTRRRVTEGRRRSRSLGLELPWLTGELAREVDRQTENENLISLWEKTEVIALILDRIQSDHLQPVMVFDDTDRWLAATDPDTISRFFREVVRWLTDLRTSVVVATHAYYLELDPASTDPPSADLLEFLDTRILIPRVPNAAMLARILEHRISCHLKDTNYQDAVLSDAVTEQAVEVLFDFYSQGTTLRKALQTAHIALADAFSAGAETIQASHVIAAQQA